MGKMSRSEAGRLGAIKTKKIWLARYEQNPKLCKFCSKFLSYNKRHNTFCDSSCAASFNNVGVRRHGRKEQQTCAFCKISIDNSKSSRKYCSLQCKIDCEWELRKEKIIQSGEEASVSCSKKFLLETRGHQCEICKNKEWNGKPIPIIMDHVNGDFSNNKLTNLRLVCGNCDMQLPTYKNKNRGNGRFLRRQRYKDGKSF